MFGMVLSCAVCKFIENMVFNLYDMNYNKI